MGDPTRPGREIQDSVYVGTLLRSEKIRTLLNPFVQNLKKVVSGSSLVFSTEFPRSLCSGSPNLFLHFKQILDFTSENFSYV